MTQSLVFTRYLYIKDEVEISLITSLLTKNERSLFWAFELYYSGFKAELFSLIWKIYYDFYAVLNPTFWEYLAKKQSELEKTDNDINFIASIISSLLIRPFNLDIYLLRQTLDKENEKKSLHSALETNDYLSIRNHIFCGDLQNTLVDALVDAITFFQYNEEKKRTILKKWKKAQKCKHIDYRAHLLSIIMSFFSQKQGIKQGKNMYVLVESDEIDKYRTIFVDPIKRPCAYKILPEVYIHSIDPENYLGLFDLERNHVDILEAYYYHWLYYASFSPAWEECIKAYNGKINHNTKTVIFAEELDDDDDEQQAFYEYFGYEPDEQKQATIEKSIQPIAENVRTWLSFYEDNKTNSLYKPNDFDLWGKIKY